MNNWEYFTQLYLLLIALLVALSLLGSFGRVCLCVNAFEIELSTKLLITPSVKFPLKMTIINNKIKAQNSSLSVSPFYIIITLSCSFPFYFFFIFLVYFFSLVILMLPWKFLFVPKWWRDKRKRYEQLYFDDGDDDDEDIFLLLSSPAAVHTPCKWYVCIWCMFVYVCINVNSCWIWV